MPHPNPAVYLRYFGANPITAVGPVSGRTYRFEGRGAAHAVDPADAPSIGTIPNMRRLAQL